MLYVMVYLIGLVMLTLKNILQVYLSIGLRVVYWSSKRKIYVYLSSIEVEYIAIFLASCEVIWINNLLCEL